MAHTRSVNRSRKQTPPDGHAASRGLAPYACREPATAGPFTPAARQDQERQLSGYNSTDLSFRARMLVAALCAIAIALLLWRLGLDPVINAVLAIAAGVGTILILSTSWLKRRSAICLAIAAGATSIPAARVQLSGPENTSLDAVVDGGSAVVACAFLIASMVLVKWDLNAPSTTDRHEGSIRPAMPTEGRKEVTAPRSQIEIDVDLMPSPLGMKGRTPELADLGEAVADPAIGLVVLSGLGGIGKTTLAARLVTDHRDQGHAPGDALFDTLCWTSLQGAPPFGEYVEGLLLRLGARLDDSGQGRTMTSALVSHLRSGRVLLVVDNFESILESGPHEPTYRAGYEEYGVLIGALSTMGGPSTVLVTSRECPRTREGAVSNSACCRVVTIGGLDTPAAKSLCREQGALHASDESWEVLCERFGGNPLALRLAAIHTLEVFGGSIDEYLTMDAGVPREIHGLLEWHVDRLTDREREVMYWLAINHTPTTLEQLRSDLLSDASRRELASTVQELSRRTIVERADLAFYLQPMLLEYLNARLIEEVGPGFEPGAAGLVRDVLLERIAQEFEAAVLDARLDILNRYPLRRADSSPHVQSAQVFHLVDPLIRRFVESYGSMDVVANQLRSLLGFLPESGRPDGYAAGNILNLLHAGGVSLDEIDAHGLPIWQACLDESTLRDANLRQCRFRSTSFRRDFEATITIAWSPSGDRLAAGTIGGRTMVWDTSKQALLLSTRSHTDWVRSLAFVSEDVVVSASDDGEVHVQQIGDTSGRPTRSIRPGLGWIRSLAADPASQRIVIGCQDGSVLVSRVDSNEVDVLASLDGACLDLHLDVTTETVFSVSSRGQIAETSLDGRHIWTDSPTRESLYAVSAANGGRSVVAGAAGGVVHVWDHERHRHELDPRLLRPVRSLSIDDDALSTWVVCSDATVRRLTNADGFVTNALVGHEAPINAIRLDPSGARLATASEDQTVRVWSAQSGRCLWVARGYANSVRSCGFIDDELVATIGEDRTLAIWNVAIGDVVHEWSEDRRISWPLAIDPHTRSIALCSTDGVVRHFTSKASQQSEFRGHNGPVRSIAFSSDGSRLVTGGADGRVRVWDASTNRLIDEIATHDDWVRAVHFCASGDLVASTSDDGSVHLGEIDAADGGRPIRTGSDIYHCLATDSTDQHSLAMGSESGLIEVIDVNTGELTFEARIEGSVRAVVISIERDRVAAGGFGGVIEVFRYSSGERIGSYQGHQNRVRCIQLVPHKPAEFLSSDDSGEVHLWNLQSDEPISRLRPRRPYEGLDVSDSSGLDPDTRRGLEALGARS